ncbi:MAG: flagellar protein FlgN [Candidatus Riflebacteria bacterium]|nr:flagellar protein FlgN [Candidatus Riflebacteria bacterium]
MQGLFSRISEILDKEFTVYSELLILSKKKRALLLEKFSTELNLIVSKEEEWVESLVPLEEDRRDIVNTLTGNPDSSIEKLIDNPECTEVIKSKIVSLSTNLKNVLTEIKQLNQENQALLEQALELTRHSLKILTSPPKDAVYKFPGAKGTAVAPSRLIDTKI